MDTRITLLEPAPEVRSIPVAAKPDRLESVDLLRGVVMIIMALDHVRDFFSFMHDPVDLKTTTPALFLTRWITHYCAPTFIFLAGTGAFLSGTRGKTRKELSWFLLTRGLWLAFFEVVINRILWMFNFDLIHYGAGVFWAIGWAMVVLSVLVYLPTWVVTLVGVMLIVGHNSFDLRPDQVEMPRWLWVILHSPGEADVVGPIALGGRAYGPITFGTGYCLLPWIGVMAAGYGFGTLLQLNPLERLRQLTQLGIAVTLGFLVFRAINEYGDPLPWQVQSDTAMTCVAFLNCTKYPASLLYVMMTLGPAILFLAIFDRPLGRLAQPVITFGRVPLFFYFLHIPLIHGGAALLDFIRFGKSPLWGHGPWEVTPQVLKQYGIDPSDYGVSLIRVYLLWIAAVLILYFPCRWYAGVKRRHRDVAWLSYL